MDWIRILLSRFAALFRSRKLDAVLDEELRAHIDLAIEENRARGMNEQRARTAALRAFGGITQIRESYRVQRGLPWIEEAVAISAMPSVNCGSRPGSRSPPSLRSHWALARPRRCSAWSMRCCSSHSLFAIRTASW